MDSIEQGSQAKDSPESKWRIALQERLPPSMYSIDRYLPKWPQFNFPCSDWLIAAPHQSSGVLRRSPSSDVPYIAHVTMLVGFRYKVKVMCVMVIMSVLHDAARSFVTGNLAHSKNSAIDVNGPLLR